MRNLKLTIEFDGTDYAGWQFQPDRRTIQGELESALRRVFTREVTVYGCGRTDAGVSARRYVANFHAEGFDLSRKQGTVPRSARRAGQSPFSQPERLRAALNHFLPADIHVHAVDVVAADFHARFSATCKTYVYRVLRGTSPLRSRHAWEYRYPLDVERVRRAARLFEGRRDYQPFCQTRDTNGTCTVDSVTVEETGDELAVAVRGDRFLYKMVRRIVGALVACGSGRITQRDIRAALAGRHCRPFTTAPAHGLLLDSVEY